VNLPTGRRVNVKAAANRRVTRDCDGKHSTGQAYKGGPNFGDFLQITAEPNFDLAIPGRKTSFGVIEAAQARGDFRFLAERSRRALHAHITHDPAAGLAAIGKAAPLALARSVLPKRDLPRCG
jgi:hypothetical protein